MLFERIPKEVEDEWLEILKEEGLDENVAKNVIAWIGGDARLMTGKPDEKTVEIVKDVLEEIPFKNLGIEDEESVKEQMIRVLESRIVQPPLKEEVEKKVPALYSPKISLIEDIEPEDIIISSILENSWELIQKDFEENGLEVVLKRFARAVVKSYEELLKLVILGNYDEHSREILYKALIKDRVKEIMMRMKEEG